jgi:PAS domain S-box-containing protein
MARHQLACSITAQDACSTKNLRVCAFVENSHEAVFFLDASGRIQYCNPCVRKKLGWMPAKLNKTLFIDLVNPEDLPHVQMLVQRCANPKSFIDQCIEVRLRAHQDSWRLFRARFCTVEHEPFGTGIVVNALDISDQRKAEHELQNALRSSTLAELVGSAAHDFNNYLMVISNSAAMAESLVDKDGELKLEIEEIRKAAGCACELARNLLAKSRETRGQFTAVDLNRLLVESGPILRRIAMRPGCEIKVKIEINPEAVVCNGNKDQLQQILANLVSNARDAIDDSGTISIHAETKTVAAALEIGGRILDPGIYSVLVVKDTGAGMTEEVAGRVFDRFFSTKPDTHGTGIGLATVKEIMDLHNGAIKLKTALGKGTEFRLFIPSAL